MSEFYYLRKAWAARRIFEALCAKPYGMTTQELIPIIYAGAAEPDYADTSIHVIICRMNRAFREEKLCLRVRGRRGPGNRYQIRVVR